MLIAPVLTKHISGVEHAFDVIEGDDLGCDGLTHAVKRQSHVTLVELGVGPNGAFNDSLVVSEHEASGGWELRGIEVSTVDP